MNHQVLIIKFGGASVSSPQSFSYVAEIISDRCKEYSHIVVVVSAMGSTTNQLIALAQNVHPIPPAREYDMLISTGERISMALLSMALQLKGHSAISFTGSQSGIITTAEHTEAKIVDVRPMRILKHLEQGKIVIVAGFQGVSLEGEITTLGRGGSDTTAVALAVALKAEKVEFFKDVLGMYDRDPYKYPDSATLFNHITYTAAREICAEGKILHHRCVVLAEKNNITLHVRPFKNFFEEQAQGTIISNKNLDPELKTSNISYESP